MRITYALAGALTATALALTGAASATAAVQTTSTATATAQADISRTKAIKIAKKRVPGAWVSDVEREYEHGHRTWKIELHKGNWEYDVYVSIKSGKIIKFKREYDD